MDLKADHADSLQLGDCLSKGHQCQHLGERKSLKSSVKGSHQNNLSPEKLWFIFFAQLHFSSPFICWPKTAPVCHLLTPFDNVRKELALINPDHIVLSGWKCVFEYRSQGDVLMFFVGDIFHTLWIKLISLCKIFTQPSPAVQRACWQKQLVAPAPKKL